MWRGRLFYLEKKRKKYPWIIFQDFLRPPLIVELYIYNASKGKRLSKTKALLLFFPFCFAFVPFWSEAICSERWLPTSQSRRTPPIEQTCTNHHHHDYHHHHPILNNDYYSDKDQILIKLSSDGFLHVMIRSVNQDIWKYTLKSDQNMILCTEMISIIIIIVIMITTTIITLARMQSVRIIYGWITSFFFFFFSPSSSCTPATTFILIN